MSEQQEIINQRQSTHGSFAENARLSQSFLHVAMTGKNWRHLNDMQLEALHMNFHKISRLLSGDHNEDDHWNDAGNYMHLPVKFKAVDNALNVNQK